MYAAKTRAGAAGSPGPRVCPCASLATERRQCGEGLPDCCTPHKPLPVVLARRLARETNRPEQAVEHGEGKVPVGRGAASPGE
jgi:hypothetical protein